MLKAVAKYMRFEVEFMAVWADRRLEENRGPSSFIWPFGADCWCYYGEHELTIGTERLTKALVALGIDPKRFLEIGKARRVMAYDEVRGRLYPVRSDEGACYHITHLRDDVAEALCENNTD